MSMQAGYTLTPDQVDEYLDFLKQGGAIKHFKTARERLQSALVVVTLRTEIHLIGMGAIKSRLPEYNEKISERSGFILSPHLRELGYIVVEKQHRGRGFSKEIVRRLLDFDDHVFATTSNYAMSRVFHTFGFIQRGEEWQGKEGDTLTLWVR